MTIFINLTLLFLIIHIQIGLEWKTYTECNIYYLKNGTIRGNSVKSTRIKAGITQAKLAEAAGITRQTVGLNEKGAYNPSLKLCLLICYAVNATIGELFWVDEEDSERRKYRMNG